MPQTTRHVQPALAPIPTAFRAWVLRGVHWAVPFLLRIRTRPWLPTGISQVEVMRPEILVEMFRQFQAGQARFMLAFRHVEVDDPLCGLYMLSRLLPQAARRDGIRLTLPLHTHFLYDRGMPLWGGASLGWLFSRIGGISFHRGKHPDWAALKSARRLMVRGQFPLAVAPEGATNGHSERLSDFEPGVAQLGFWCAEDLEKEAIAPSAEYSGKSAQSIPGVWLVPVSLRYDYPNPSWEKLDRLMRQLETTSGLAPYAVARVAGTRPEDWYHQRLLRLGTHLLETMEQFYQQFYHCSLGVSHPGGEAVPGQAGKPPSQATGKSKLTDLVSVLRTIEQQEAPPLTIDQRLQELLTEALKVAESFFGVPSRGSLADRCRRIEEASWSYIYRADVTDRAALSPLQRGLGDWVAEEASLRSLHMRLVESLVSVSTDYVAEHPSFERLAETTLLLFDVMARVRGDRYLKRPRLGLRRARFTVNAPISVSDRLPHYQTNRRAAKEAIAHLTQTLREALDPASPLNR